MNLIQLNPGMGEAILAHLATLAPLPTAGVIAGQSVASAIDDLFGIGGGVYNDIDVFRRVPRPSHKLKRQLDNETVTQTSPFLHMPPKPDRYGALTRCLAAMSSYAVSSVSRDGLINHVNCLPLGNLVAYEGVNRGHIVPERLLASFDLSCVRVAVDIGTKQLTWLPEYERFLATRQIEIACMQTPFHTFLRALKKVRELPAVYTDVEANAEAACAMYHSKHYDVLREEKYLVSRFGSKMHELAMATENIWSPYFRIEESQTKDGKAKLFTLVPKAMPDPKLQEAVDSLSVNSIHYAPRVVYRIRRRHSSKTAQRVAQTLASTEAGSFVNLHALMLGEDYVTGQFSPTHVETVDRFVRAHDSLETALSGHSLDTQYRTVLHLKHLERTYGRGVMGLVRHVRTLQELNSDSLEARIKRQMEEMLKPFAVRPLALPKLPEKWSSLGYTVEELLTPALLADEGEKMHHCVAGYASSVRENQCRILRIRTGPSAKRDGSTMELGVSPLFLKHADKPWQRGIPAAALSNRQHRSFCNGEPSDLHREIAQYVIEHANGSWQDALRWRIIAGRDVISVDFWRRQYRDARWYWRCRLTPRWRFRLYMLVQRILKCRDNDVLDTPIPF